MGRLARMASRRTGVRITDATSGFRAIGPNVLGPFASIYPAEYLGDTIESLARAGRAGYRVMEVPGRDAGREVRACRRRRRSRRRGIWSGSWPRCGCSATGRPAGGSCR